MPDITPCSSYPYPLPADPIQTATDVQALAEAIDTDLCEVECLPDGNGGHNALVFDDTTQLWHGSTNGGVQIIANAAAWALRDSFLRGARGIWCFDLNMQRAAAGNIIAGTTYASVGAAAAPANPVFMTAIATLSNVPSADPAAVYPVLFTILAGSGDVVAQTQVSGSIVATNCWGSVTWMNYSTAGETPLADRSVRGHCWSDRPNRV